MKKEGGNWHQSEYNRYTGGKRGISNGGHQNELNEEIASTVTHANNIVNTTNDFDVSARNNVSSQTHKAMIAGNNQ